MNVEVKQYQGEITDPPNDVAWEARVEDFFRDDGVTYRIKSL